MFKCSVHILPYAAVLYSAVLNTTRKNVQDTVNRPSLCGFVDRGSALHLLVASLPLGVNEKMSLSTASAALWLRSGDVSNKHMFTNTASQLSQLLHFDSRLLYTHKVVAVLGLEVLLGESCSGAQTFFAVVACLHCCDVSEVCPVVVQMLCCSQLAHMSTCKHNFQFSADPNLSQLQTLIRTVLLTALVSMDFKATGPTKGVTAEDAPASSAACADDAKIRNGTPAKRVPRKRGAEPFKLPRCAMG